MNIPGMSVGMNMPPQQQYGQPGMAVNMGMPGMNVGMNMPPQPYGYPQQQYQPGMNVQMGMPGMSMNMGVPQTHVVVQEHHHVMHQPVVTQSVGSVSCPVCSGKGGLGTFGPCTKGDMHFKKTCPFCDGNGTARAGSRACHMCNGKGGLGTFGPCDFKDIHFKSTCNVCNGKCHIY